MGILDRALRKGINRAVGDAVSGAVQKAVAPAINRTVNSVAQSIDQSTQEYARSTQSAPTVSGAELEGAFASLSSAMNGFASQAAKNTKMCAACGAAAPADHTFCPACGARLPEQTVAEGAVCTSCGRQNNIGTRFCAGCGAKLPAAEAQEAAQKAASEAVLAQWDTLLPQYPKWCFGGEIRLFEDSDGGIPRYNFWSADGTASELERYRMLLKQNGFTQAGEYPSDDMLYKMVDGVCYCFESCDPFVTDGLSVSFGRQEPKGGFYYKKPEPKKPVGLRDLFGL